MKRGPSVEADYDFTQELAFLTDIFPARILPLLKHHNQKEFLPFRLVCKATNQMVQNADELRYKRQLEWNKKNPPRYSNTSNNGIFSSSFTVAQNTALLQINHYVHSIKKPLNTLLAEKEAFEKRVQIMEEKRKRKEKEEKVSSLIPQCGIL